MTDWRVYLRKLLTLRPSLHCISSQRRTPFLELVAGYLDYGESERESFRANLLIWIEDLHDCGIDLEEYGRKEIELHEHGLTTWLFHLEVLESDSVRRNRRFSMELFTYGPLPSDWDVVVQKRVPVPGNSAKVPGGWVEDGDDEDGCKEQDVRHPRIWDL